MPPVPDNIGHLDFAFISPKSLSKFPAIDKAHKFCERNIRLLNAIRFKRNPRFPKFQLSILIKKGHILFGYLTDYDGAKQCIADSKIELFLEKNLQFADLTVLRLLRYTIISFTLELIGHTTTYCAGSLVEIIIIIVPFDMQSAYSHYFRSRHVSCTFRQAKIDHLS